MPFCIENTKIDDLEVVSEASIEKPSEKVFLILIKTDVWVILDIACIGTILLSDSSGLIR